MITWIIVTGFPDLRTTALESAQFYLDLRSGVTLAEHRLAHLRDREAPGLTDLDLAGH